GGGGRAGGDDIGAGLALAEREARGPTRWVGNAADALGATLAALGEHDRAAALFDRAIEALRSSGAPNVRDPLAHASRLALVRGDRTTARARLADAMKAAH